MVLGCIFFKSLGGYRLYYSCLYLKILPPLNERVLTVQMNTGIAARHSRLLMWHWYFTYCKTSTLSSTTSWCFSALLSNWHTILYGRQAILFAGDSSLGPFLPAYPAFIFSLCFDGNYHLWMQETWGEK